MLLIPTECDGVCVRELSSSEDDEAYYRLVNANGARLARGGISIANAYPDIESVRDHRLELAARSAFKMGIFVTGRMAGSVDVYHTSDDGSTPTICDDAEIAFWLDTTQEHRGIATFAVMAVSKYVLKKSDLVYANILKDNNKSIGVVERSGFVLSSDYSDGMLTFEKYGSEYR